MTAVLRYTLIVRHPDTDAPTAVLEGQPVPDWASELVHEDDLVELDGDGDAAAKAKADAEAQAAADAAAKAKADAEAQAAADAAAAAEPPRSGKGSGMGEWNEYAASLGIEVPADASRDDIFALVDQHKAAAGNGDVNHN